MFEVDPGICPDCGGAMRRVAEVVDAGRTWEVLRWMEAQARSPPPLEVEGGEEGG